MKNKEFVWDYNMYGDPKMCGIYDLKKRKWWLYTLEHGRLDDTISNSREELECKLAKRGLYMAKKMYHHMTVRWPLTGKLVINEYQYLVY